LVLEAKANDVATGTRRAQPAWSALRAHVARERAQAQQQQQQQREQQQE
jgi:hypothetical protein